jgi:hypothetical protein
MPQRTRYDIKQECYCQEFVLNCYSKLKTVQFNRRGNYWLYLFLLDTHRRVEEDDGKMGRGEDAGAERAVGAIRNRSLTRSSV